MVALEFVSNFSMFHFKKVEFRPPLTHSANIF